ncbi:MAG: carotenoid biosynthesis protein [bacterium]
MTLPKLKIQNLDQYLNTLFSIFYVFGVIFFSLDFGFVLMKNLSEIFLYLCAFGFFLAVFWSYQYQAKFNYKLFLIWALITFTTTLVLEMIGTATGVIFGNYKYGQVLSLQLFSTPVIIVFNWVILIISGSEISRRFVGNLTFLNKQNGFIQLFFSAIISAVLISFFDYVMEPVAVYLDYWNWGSSDIYQIPGQNYIAWFGISLAFSLWYLSLKIKIKSSFVRNIFWLQLLFFVLLRVFLV